MKTKKHKLKLKPEWIDRIIELTATEDDQEIYEYMQNNLVVTQSDIIEATGSSSPIISQNIGYMRRKGIDMSKITRKTNVSNLIVSQVPQPT